MKRGILAALRGASAGLERGQVDNRDKLFPTIGDVSGLDMHTWRYIVYFMGSWVGLC